MNYMDLIYFLKQNKSIYTMEIIYIYMLFIVVAFVICVIVSHRLNMYSSHRNKEAQSTVNKVDDIHIEVLNEVAATAEKVVFTRLDNKKEI